MKQKNPILVEVFASFGSAAKLAAHLGITRSAVAQWQVVPLKYIREVSQATGIPRSKLRPDLYE